MAAVAELAQTHAQKLIDELPPVDRETRARRVEELSEDVHANLMLYLWGRFVELGYGNWRQREQELAKLLEYTNYHDDHPDETQQRFIEDHIPYWEAFAQHCIALSLPEWRQKALDLASE